MKLYGEGNYAINDVYEVQVTEDYLGLNHGCNANQNREECETAKYLENIQSQCNCTPITYRSFFPNEVRFFFIHFKSNIKDHFKESMILA